MKLENDDRDESWYYRILKVRGTSKNLAKIFRKVAQEDCIILIDEFDSLGKVRDYSQKHGEMKRVVNTILQLFD